MKTFNSFWSYLLLLTVLVIVNTTVSAQLKAGFSASVRSGCSPLFVSFKDSSFGNPTSWKWDLGNGTVSYLKNPSNTYFASGSYTIKLLVKNENGADSLVLSKFIVVSALPLPDFKASDTSGCFPLKVRFTDKSLGGSAAVTTWQWDFGDGTLSNEKNPVHTYMAAGSYTIVLRVTNNNGCSKSIIRSSYINLKNGVKADFSYRSPAGCYTPTTVNFSNETVGTGAISYLWDFGNGKISTDKNPVSEYQSAGVYTVRLIATNSLGCSDTMVKPNAINIGFVSANFTKPDTVCAGAVFRLTNTSGPSTFVGSFWDFSDGTFSDSLHTSKSYAASGNYKIKLVTDFGSCRDSVIKPIRVVPQAAVSFAAVAVTGCSTPKNITFRNTSANGVSFFWDFGDGTTSSLENPVHTYTKSKNYTVTLTVKNTTGCFGTLVKKDFIQLSGPKITAIDSLPFKGCVPSVVKPVAVINSNVAVKSYLWNFGDGKTSADSLPSHTYTMPGNYNVKLTITTVEGCIDTLTVVNGVQAGVKPTLQFSGTPLDVCALTPVTFTDLSSGAIPQEWLWYFGDGSNSQQQNPVHSYSSPGKFSVTLIASNYGCSDTLKKTNYVNVRPPIAKFDTSFLCNDPLKRNFIDKSIGAKTWHWNFGDGDSTDAVKPMHTYAAPGTYQVSLTVTNGSCENIIKKDVLVIKETGTLAASVTENCINAPVAFTVANINTANFSTYAWYYNSLTEVPVVTISNANTYVYTSAGPKYPLAIITNKLGCKDTLHSSVPVTIYGSKAAFSSSVLGGCLGNTINFIDSTKTDGVHPVVSWTWNFGEGAPQSYTTAPFAHTYNTTGNFNVKLAVKDSYGCVDSVSKPAYISVTKPVAGFKASDTLICPKAPITFANTSQGAGAVYYWQFGDSTTSTDISPVHTFADTGIYRVIMVMTDKNGCTDSAAAFIKIFTATSAFALSDSFSNCPPLIVKMTNQSKNFVKLNWSFGDGGTSELPDPSHIYTYPGIYSVKLKISNNGGCTDSVVHNVVIEGPTGVFSYTPKEVCNAQIINFALQSQNAVSYIWDFNDGTAVQSSSLSQSHTYTTPGIYLPKIILEDSKGCKVPLLGLDTIRIYGIEANISSDARLLCDSGYVAFKDSSVSNDVVNKWLWNFGDGTTSPEESPNHKFANTGLYTVTLISKNRFGCADTAVNTKYIKVISSPKIKITGDADACAPSLLNFAGEFVRTDTSAVTWKWDFGNGNTAQVIKPAAQIFDVAGEYSVTAEAINSDGCYDSVTSKIIIHPKPIVNAGADTAICRFNSLTLHAAGAQSYLWGADQSLSCTACANPVAKPGQTAIYHLTGKTVFGCTNEDSIVVKVMQPFKIEVSKDDTLCRGESLVLSATGAQLYQWTPSSYLDNANIGTPKSTPDASITYSVTGKDSVGCFNDKKTVTLKVYPKPAIEITNGENITLSAGANINLLTKNSADINKWKWTPDKWLSCSSCAQTITSPQSTITYKVTGFNEGKCEAQDEITVNIVCNNANIYIPNTFSPNNDGSNDAFYPRGTGMYSVKSFKIFNRWGQMVFSKNNIRANDPLFGWDGTMNGMQSQPDVYIYMMEVICSNNTVLPFKGNVTLIR